MNNIILIAALAVLSGSPNEVDVDDYHALTAHEQRAFTYGFLDGMYTMGAYIVYNMHMEGSYDEATIDEWANYLDYMHRTAPAEAHEVFMRAEGFLTRAYALYLRNNKELK